MSAAFEAIEGLTGTQQGMLLGWLASACTDDGAGLAEEFWYGLAFIADAPNPERDTTLLRAAQDMAARRAYEKQATAQARRDAERAFGLGIA